MLSNPADWPAAGSGLQPVVLWGVAAAAGVIGAAMAYALEQRRKRKEEEARARAEAERANADARAREQAQRDYQAALNAAEEARRQAALAAAADEALAKLRAKNEDKAPLDVAKVPPPPPTPNPAWDMAAWKQRDYAEMAEWEQHQQPPGPMCTPDNIQKQKPWWQTAWDWITSPFKGTGNTPGATPTASATPPSPATPKPISTPIPIPVPTPSTLPSGTPTIFPTPGPMYAPENIQEPRPWWVSSFSVEEASRLVRAIPSVGVGSDRIPVPVARIVAPGKMISFGTVTAWDLTSAANPNAELWADGVGAGAGENPQTLVRVNKNEVEAGLRVPTGLGFKQDGFSGSLGYSINLQGTWNGWDTTVSVDVNYADLEASGAGVKGNISSGVYLEVKPLQVATVAVVVAAVVLTPFDELAALARSGWLILQEAGREMLPRLLPGFGG